MLPQLLMVGNSQVFSGLGINRDEALENRLEFSKRLYVLANAMLDALDEKDMPEELPDDPQTALEALGQVLTLEKEKCFEALDDLREIGAPMYAELSEELVNVFRRLGFHASEGDDEHTELPLNFLVTQNHENTKAPILWEMMYQGNQTEWPPKWEKFWGFRAPITQWLAQMDRSETIELGRALSVVNQDLDFSGHEVTLLVQYLNQRRLRGLEEVFRQQVHKALQERMRQDAGQIDAWWEQCETQGNDWLGYFLSWLANKREEKRWKRRALQSIFKDSPQYDLIHFACHCSASEVEFLSELEIKVAGGCVSLNVGFMSSDLKRKSEWQLKDPGPLVFLNACGTGQQSDHHQPPGFPVEWIQAQGAKAVIVTLCPVPDYFAYAFALKFYDILLNVKPFVDEALLETRRFFMRKYNNPLGLAYVLYAVKDAQVLADFEPEGGAL